MKIRKQCRSAAAWMLTLSMVMSSSVFAAQAGERPDAEPSMLAEEVSTELENAEVSDTMPTEAPETLAERTPDVDLVDAETQETVPAETPAAVAAENSETSEAGVEETSGTLIGTEESGNPEAETEESGNLEVRPEESGNPETPAAPEEALFSDGTEASAVTDGENLPSDGEEKPPVGTEENEIRLSWGDQYGWTNEDGSIYSWLFEDSQFTVHLTGPLPEGYSVEWAIECYEVKNHTPMENRFIEKVSSDNESIVLKGLSASSGIAEPIITAVVKNREGEEIARPAMALYVLETYYDCSYDYDEYHNTLLIDEYRGIGSGAHCDIQDPAHPEGSSLDIPFTDVKVVQYTYGENGEEILVDSGVVELDKNEEGYYGVIGRGYGHAVVTVTHHASDDPKSELVTRSFDFYVQGDKYWLDIVYPNPANQWVLPGGEMVIGTSVRHDWYRSEEDRGSEEITSYRLEVAQPEGFNFDVRVDGGNIILKALDNERWGWWNAVVKAVVLNAQGEPAGQECENAFSAGVRDEFDVVTVSPEEREAFRSLAPGGEMQIHPTFTHVTGGGETVVDPKEYVYRWEWDEHALQITDASGKILTQEDKHGTAPFTIRKINSYGTDCWLAVDRYDGENIYESQSIQLFNDGQDFSFRLDTKDERYDEWRNTWIFSDEEMVLTLAADGLKDVDYTVDWLVGFVEENGEIRNPVPADGTYYIGDQSSITLYGAKLAELFRPGTAEDGFEVRARISIGGILMEPEGRIWVGGVYDPEYHYQWPCEEPGDRNLFPGGEIFIPGRMDAYVRDSAHPYGEDTQVRITEVRPVQSWQWNPGTEQEEIVPESLVEITPKEDGWTIRVGERFGRTDLELICQSLKPGEDTHSYSEDHLDGETPYYFDVSIVDEDWYLNLEYPDESGNQMLPYGTKTVTTTLVHEYLDEKGEHQYEEIENYHLYLAWENGTPTYNADWVRAEIVDYTSVKITARDEEHAGYDAVLVRVMVPDEEGRYVWADDTNLWINVAPEYNVIIPEELTTSDGKFYNVEKGQELDLGAFDPKIKHFSQNPEENGKILTGENYRIRLREGESGYDPNVWSVKAGTETQLLPVLIRNGKNPSWGTAISLVGERKALDENGNPVKDEQGNDIWEELAGIDYYFNELCEEHSWLVEITEATFSSPKVIFKRCERCGVETRETEGFPLLREAELVNVEAEAYNKIKVTWKAVEGADGYRILRKAPGEKKWKRIKTVGASSTSFVDSSLSFGKKYRYTVRAYRGEGDTLELGAFNKKGLSVKTALGSVQLKKATASYNSIQVTWTKKAGASGYIVYRKTGKTDWQRVGTAAASAVSFTDKKVVTGTKYTYTVQAYRTVNKKNVKGTYDQKGVSAKAALSKVTGVVLSAGADHSITIKWKATPGATGYQIWSRTGEDGKFVKLVSVKTGTSCVHTDLKAGTSYSYRIRPFRQISASPAKYVYGTLNKPQTIVAR